MGSLFLYFSAHLFKEFFFLLVKFLIWFIILDQTFYMVIRLIYRCFL